eukprot:7484779-Pyramimonas_sp.AAC.1
MAGKPCRNALLTPVVAMIAFDLAPKLGVLQLPAPRPPVRVTFLTSGLSNEADARRERVSNARRAGESPSHTLIRYTLIRYTLIRYTNDNQRVIALRISALVMRDGKTLQLL